MGLVPGRKGSSHNLNKPSPPKWSKHCSVLALRQIRAATKWNLAIPPTVWCSGEFQSSPRLTSSENGRSLKLDTDGKEIRTCHNANPYRTRRSVTRYRRGVRISVLRLETGPLFAVKAASGSCQGSTCCPVTSSGSVIDLTSVGIDLRRHLKDGELLLPPAPG